MFAVISFEKMRGRCLVWPNWAEQVNNRKCPVGPAWWQACQVGDDDDLTKIESKIWSNILLSVVSHQMASADSNAFHFHLGNLISQKDNNKPSFLQLWFKIWRLGAGGKYKAKAEIAWDWLRSHGVVNATSFQVLLFSLSLFLSLFPFVGAYLRSHSGHFFIGHFQVYDDVNLTTCKANQSTTWTYTAGLEKIYSKSNKSSILRVLSRYRQKTLIHKPWSAIQDPQSMISSPCRHSGGRPGWAEQVEQGEGGQVHPDHRPQRLPCCDPVGTILNF